jgi:hypothetical protein
MIKTRNKFVRCPYINKNFWIKLDIDRDIDGSEVLVGMTCIKRDSLERQEKDCGTECKNYFYSED